MAESPVVWLTGLPSSGKTTLALALAARLRAEGIATEVLDGDEVRLHFGPLGFSRADRFVNVHRVGYVANLLARNGVVAVCALVSPYRLDRDAVRQSAGKFCEVYVDAPLDVCRQRDVRGLYASGVPGLTGVDDPYEAPPAPDVIVRTAVMTVDECVDAIRSQIGL